MIAFTPYRICPIGAHSDTQLGYVTGMAIDKGITMEYEPTSDGSFCITSGNFSGEARFRADAVPPKQGDWADYLRGAVTALKSRMDERTAAGESRQPVEAGLKAHITGSLPIGGLSSSAAVVISFLSALCAVNGIRLTEKEMIVTAQQAENQYVGVNCGTLDQSCEVLCRKDHLLYLDTRDGSYELIPTNPRMKPYKIAIFFSGVERSLAGSKFNMRVDELKAASYALKDLAGLEYGKFKESVLRDVSVEIFRQYGDRLPVHWRMRAEHWYTEQARVEAGVRAWRDGDLDAYGRLSFESGWSSINNYETGSDELKTLYDIMRETDGVYGGRFSGAGFKGCCMALIDPSRAQSIEQTVTEKYLKVFPELTGRFSVHFCHSADGVGMQGGAK